MDTVAPAAPDSSHSHCARPPRSLAPDLARGLMLLLIVLANSSWFLWGREVSGFSAHVPAEGPLDRALQALMAVAVDGRSYPLFAVLFGYGMVQFARSRVGRGIEPTAVRRMLRRRHWAMILLGALHAALLFYGDVLGAYGVAGLVLVWLFFGRRDRTLLVWSIVLTALHAISAALSVVSGLLLARAADPAMLAQMEASGGFDMGAFRDLAYGDASYLVSAGVRLGTWLPVTIGQGLFSMIPIAILLGWLAARHRVLDEPWNHVRLLRRTAVIGIAVGWAGGVPSALVALDVIALPDALSWTFLGLTSVTGLGAGLGYAALFGLLATRVEAHTEAMGRMPLPARALSAVGKRSLTFYLFQSLLMAPLMAGWGLGLGEHLGTTQVLAVALGVWLLSLPLAMVLEARDRRGPAEVLLRRLTYGRHDPAGGAQAAREKTSTPSS